MRLFIQDLKKILIKIGDGLLQCLYGLITFLANVCYLILFMPIQLCLSIYYIIKYIVRNHYRVIHANKEELERVIKPYRPKKYYCLGLKLNNYLVIKLAKKRLEQI